MSTVGYKNFLINKALNCYFEYRLENPKDKYQTINVEIVDSDNGENCIVVVYADKYTLTNFIDWKAPLHKLIPELKFLDEFSIWWESIDLNPKDENDRNIVGYEEPYTDDYTGEVIREPIYDDSDYCGRLHITNVATGEEILIGVGEKFDNGLVKFDVYNEDADGDNYGTGLKDTFIKISFKDTTVEMLKCKCNE